MQVATGRLRWRLAGLLAPATLAALCSAAAPAWGVQVALSPLNGTPDASPYSQISFLGVPAREIRDVSVVGSRSGRHTGHLKAYVSAPGASLLLGRPFSQGERVRVTAVVGARGHARTVRSSFSVARLSNYPVLTGKPLELRHAGLDQTFASQPRLVPPVVDVTADAGESSGDVFLTPTHGYGQSGAMIVNSAGGLVWFHPSPSGEEANNLRVQSYRGRPVLTWWQGRVAWNLGIGLGTDEIVDSAYRPIATVRAGNGYQADLHEFDLTPQGSAFLTAYSVVSADLSSVGGKKDGILQDAIVQEIDVPTGLVMFEWHADGHVGFEESNATIPRYVSWAWDYFHVNSISVDPWGDGNLLVSSRATWAAYEVDHITGAVLWRLGGRHSSFTMGPGTGTAWQHDVEWQPDHTLTIFDNGANPKVHSESRVIRERIDWAHKRLALVDRYSAHILSGSQGNYQFLNGGNAFVGWGEAPFMTEFSPTGQVLFSARIPWPGQSYRAYRFPWDATPGTQPAIAVSSSPAGEATVRASWNGATGVSSWRLLGGEASSGLEALQAVPATGFETAIAVPGGAEYLAVQALGSQGQVLGTSETLHR